MYKKILVVAPHADDELIGIGGSLLKWKEAGHSIKIVLVACSDIYMRHLDRVIPSIVRENEFRVSAEKLSTEPCSILGFTDSKLDTMPAAEITHALDLEIAQFRPSVFLYPEPSYHQDHQAVNRACTASLRPTILERPKIVMTYEIPTSSWVGSGPAFIPNVYVDISETLEEKIDTFKRCYESQFTTHERNGLAQNGILAHARSRGFEANLSYAEAFRLIVNTEIF